MLRALSIAVVVTLGLGLAAAAEEAPPPARASASPSAAAAADNASRPVAKPARRVPRHAHARPARGYGFLPGYEPPPDNNRPDMRRRARADGRPGPYWSWGNRYYGWGTPGYVRGRWNGGSIGPCWKSTPIGFVWICG